MNKTIFLAFLSLLLIGSCGVSGGNDKQCFDSGLAALKEGDVDRARTLFNSIDSLFPESPYYLYGLGLLFEKERLIPDAANAYYRLIDSFPEFQPGLKSWALFSSKSGFDETALEAAYAFSKLEKDDAAAAAISASVLYNIGEYGRATELINKRIAGESQDPDFLMLGAWLNLHAGDVKAGLEECSQALQYGADRLDIIMRAGNLMAAVGEIDSAAALYHSALTLDENDFFLKADVAEALIDIGYYYQAEKLLAELERIEGGAYVPYFLRLKLLTKTGKYIEGMTYFENIPGKFPNCLGSFMHRAAIQDKAGHESGGIRSIDAALAIAQSWHDEIRVMDDMLFDKVDLLLRNDLWGEAKSLIMENGELFPKYFRSLKYAARIYMIAPFKKVEVPDYPVQLIELMGDNPERIFQVGQLYADIDSTERALGFFEQALEIDKFNISAIAGKAGILVRTNRAKEAVGFLDSLDEHILFNDEFFPIAVSLYEKAGNDRKALDLAELGLDKGRQDIYRYRLAAELAVKKNREKSAREFIKKCLAENPGNPLARFLAGEIFVRIGDNKGGTKLFYDVLMEDSTFSEAWYHLGRLYEKAGQSDSAGIFYEKAIAFNPQYGEALGALAKLMVDRGDDDLREISNYLRKAMKYSTSPEYNVTMGRIQLQQERYKAAGRNFGAALEKEPNNPEYNYYAGINYIKLDSLQKARRFLKKAVDNGLAGELKNKAESALKNL